MATAATAAEGRCSWAGRAQAYRSPVPRICWSFGASSSLQWSRTPSLPPPQRPCRQQRWGAAARATAAGEQEFVATSSRGRGSGTAKRVVITGGSKGLGFAMAREFLALGDSVALCGRDAARCAAAVAALRREFGEGRVHGMACDCSSPDDMQQFGDFVQQSLGGCDIWINNAGEVTAKRLLDEVEGAEVARVVGTNVVGSLLGSQQAIRLMWRQALPAGTAAGQPTFHILNMGFSRWGAKLTKSAVTHKATKRAVTQVMDSLADDLREAGVTSIGVHNLSPGMLLTDLLLRDSTPGARRFFNALAEEPETVAAEMVPRVRALQGSGQSIDYLTPADALRRILTGLPQIINGGRFFDKEGRRVAQPGERYQPNGVRVQVPQD